MIPVMFTHQQSTLIVLNEDKNIDFFKKRNEIRNEMIPVVEVINRNKQTQQYFLSCFFFFLVLNTIKAEVLMEIVNSKFCFLFSSTRRLK